MSDTRYTLPADLPQDWTRGQVVAPDGVAVGLSEQHGFNYLCRQVNEAQRVINAQGAIIEELRGELAGKADRQRPVIYELEMSEGFVSSGDGQYQNNYSKDVFGTVTVRLAAMTADGKDSIGKGRVHVAQLPEGFHPVKEVIVPIYLHSLNPRTAYLAGMAIQPDGTVAIASYNSEGAAVMYGEVSFLAAHS